MSKADTRIAIGKARDSGGQRTWRAALYAPAGGYSLYRVTFKEQTDTDCLWTARTAPTEAEARQIFSQVEKALDAMVATPVRANVQRGRTGSAFTEAFLADSRAQAKAVRTIEQRENRLRVHIDPVLGDVLRPWCRLDQRLLDPATLADATAFRGPIKNGLMHEAPLLASLRAELLPPVRSAPRTAAGCLRDGGDAGASCGTGPPRATDRFARTLVGARGRPGHRTVDIRRPHHRTAAAVGAVQRPLAPSALMARSTRQGPGLAEARRLPKPSSPRRRLLARRTGSRLGRCRRLARRHLATVLDHDVRSGS